MMEGSQSRILGGSISSMGLFLRRRLWIWPIIAALGLSSLGWWVRSTVETETKAKMASDLKTILDADVAAMRIWLKAQESDARAVAKDTHVVTAVSQLLEIASQPDATPAMFLQSAALTELRLEVTPWLEAQDYHGFIIVSRDGIAIAAQQDDWVGKSIPPEHRAQMDPVFAGRALVTRPEKSLILLRSADGKLEAGVPTMFALAPINTQGEDVTAVVGLRIRPEADFTRILAIARAGESGETYAFDKNGLLLSQSRFDEDLKQIGLITDSVDSHSILNLQIRDPEVDMTSGKRPKKRRSEQELTRMAADAVAGNDGVDVDGYPDYRGVPVVGAWTWLEDYGFGVATEVDVAEAFRPLYVLRTAFAVVFGFLGASAVAIFVFSIVAARLGRKARKAALDAMQLGQYTLDEKIGAGGMGVVYRAHHAMLRRPTAVKLLDIEKTTDQSIARFEREVRLTSQLNHPNTVAIYDFGRTPEGIFYYAMEYLDGITLEDLAGRHGPQSEGRVIHILRQLCGSLNEAHEIGLIHRDVKPANAMIGPRGGMFDVVKLLDFGLVKAVDSQRESNLTAAGALTGTPLYMSPEAVNEPDKVDNRSDLYAVGAIGYYLLTGSPVFEGRSAVEICMHQANTTPQRPSKRLGTTVSQDLEDLLLGCLAKNPEDRPSSAAILTRELDACREAFAWTRADARTWWDRNSSPVAKVSPPESAASEDVGETIVQDDRATPGT